MWGSILGMVLPIALRFVGLYLDNKSAQDDTKRMFFQFLDSLYTGEDTPKKLHASLQAQLDAFKNPPSAISNPPAPPAV